MIDLYKNPDIYDQLVPWGLREDEPFYLASTAQIKQPVLELMAGTGRLTIPMAKQGVNITGLDLSKEMLAKAETNAKQAGVNIPFIHGDATNFQLNKKFGLIIIPASALLLLDSKESIEKCLKCAKDHLLPGGKLIIDVITLACIEKTPRDNKFKTHRYTSSSGKDVDVVLTDFQYDSAEKLFSYNFLPQDTVSGQEIRRDKVTLKMYTPEELRALLYQQGFNISKEYGDYSRNPFHHQSMHQIIVCQPN